MKSFVRTSGYILLYLIIYFIYQVKFMIVASLIALFFGVKSENLINLAVPILLPSAIVSFAFYWLILKSRKIKIIEYCRFKRIKIKQAILIVIMIVCLVATVQMAISDIMKCFADYNSVNNTMSKEVSNKFSLVCVTLFIPIFEEILFRGIILNDLKNKINVNAAIILQGVIFGIYHFNTVQSIYAGIFGIILGFIYIWTGSIIATIIGHITFNISGVIIMPHLFNVYQQYTDQFGIGGGIIFIFIFFIYYKISTKKAEQGA